MYMLAIPDLTELDPMSMWGIPKHTQSELDKTRLDVHVGQTRPSQTRPDQFGHRLDMMSMLAIPDQPEHNEKCTIC